MTIRLLTPPVNYAICKMEERNYPGVVVQGDSFFSVLHLMKNIHNSMKEKCSVVLEDEIIDIKYQIDLYEDVILQYEKACKENGFDLPYVK